MKEKIKNVTILKKTVRPENGKMLKPSWICSTLTEFRNSGFATVCSICSLSGLVTTPSVRKSAVQDDMFVQNDMGWFRRSLGALAPDKNFSPFTSHFSRKSAFTLAEGATQRICTRTERSEFFQVSKTTLLRTVHNPRHVERQHNKRRTAFTLAEVLITLGIIGVVAAMTLPSLIAKHQKKVVEARLAKFYSSINQAVQLAEVQYGDKKYWYQDLKGAQQFDKEGNPIEGSSEAQQWFNKYLAPNLKIVKEELIKSDGRLKIYFSDGTELRQMNIANTRDWVFYASAKGKCDFGKCAFYFNFMPNSTNYVWRYNYNKGFEPWKYNWDGNYETLKTGCKSNTWYCAAIIQYNGWKIPDDYPIKF